MTYEIRTKESRNVWNGSEWVPGAGGTLYAVVFADGYHTVWYTKRANAEKAAERRVALAGRV